MNANGEIKKSYDSKFKSSTLILFLSFNHEKLSEMLDYIIKMPPDECSHDRGHKHPFTVSELFSCEITQINELFFTAPPLTYAIKKEAVDVNNSDQEAVEIGDDEMP